MTDPDIGLSNISVSVQDYQMDCRFTRKNSVLNNELYFSMNDQKFSNIIGAYGRIRGAGIISKHVRAGISQYMTDFSNRKNAVVNASTASVSPIPTIEVPGFDFLNITIPEISISLPDSPVSTLFENLFENLIDIFDDSNDTSENLKSKVDMKNIISMVQEFVEKLMSCEIIQEAMSMCTELLDKIMPGGYMNKIIAKKDLVKELASDKLIDDMTEFGLKTVEKIRSSELELMEMSEKMMNKIRSPEFLDKMTLMKEELIDKLMSCELTQKLMECEYVQDIMLSDSLQQVMSLEYWQDLMKILQGKDFKMKILKYFMNKLEFFSNQWSMTNYNNLETHEKIEYFKNLAVVQRHMSDMNPDFLNMLIKSSPKFFSDMMECPEFIKYASKILRKLRFLNKPHKPLMPYDDTFLQYMPYNPQNPYMQNQ